MGGGPDLVDAMVTDTDKLVEEAVANCLINDETATRNILRDLIEKVEELTFIRAGKIPITANAPEKMITLEGGKYLVYMNIEPEHSKAKTIAIPCPEDCGFLDYDGDKRAACACTDGYLMVEEFAAYHRKATVEACWDALRDKAIDHASLAVAMQHVQAALDAVLKEEKP